MKKTKLFLSYVSFWYDCWHCGHANNIVYDSKGFYAAGSGSIKGHITDKSIKVKCNRCGKFRKGIIDLNRTTPLVHSKKKLKKLNKLEKEWCKKHSSKPHAINKERGKR